eukprot:439877_1
MSSDLKKIETEFIQHEISSAAEEFNNNKLIKLIFHHQCRGDANYDKDDGCVNKQRTGNRTKNTYERVRTKSSDGAVNTYRSIEMSSITTVHTNDTMEEEEEKYQDNNGCVAFDSNWITIYGKYLVALSQIQANLRIVYANHLEIMWAEDEKIILVY